MSTYTCHCLGNEKCNIYFIGGRSSAVLVWVSVARENARLEQTLHSYHAHWFPGNSTSTLDMQPVYAYHTNA